MGNVPAGEYYVKELVAPAGYELDTETHVVTVKAAETTRVDLRDVPSKGNADIVKRSDAPDKTDGNPNYSLAGIVYNAYADEACTEKLDWWLTLDESGHAYKGNLALGTYWLKEDPASLVGKPFEVDKTAHRVDVKANATSYLKVTDHALFGSAEIVKTSSASNISDGTPYLDASCTAGLLDSQLSLVYGHHLNDGSVFSDLALYADEGFLKRHQEIALHTPEHDVTYRVIAARKVDASAENSVVEFPSTASLREWLSGQLEIADARLAGDFATNRLLALVTCSYGTFKNERTIVYAIPISCDGETIRYPSDMNRLLGKSGA